jgi:peptidoglycan/xylan/chitin deacetylase (PgdA/CDA1 family)
MYHGISKTPKSNCITVSTFHEQLSWLKEKYTVVPLSVLVNAIKEPLSGNPSDLASITFDDGYTNFAELALPLLQEYQLHATLFVLAGKIGCYNDWDETMNGFQRMEIMPYSMLSQLPENVVEVGSHGLSHIPLGTQPYEIIEREIVQSRVEIEQNIGRPVKFFAFPFGVYPFKYRSKLYDTMNNFIGGYSAACTSWWGRYNALKDINMLRRITIWDSDSFADFRDKLQGSYDWLEKKERIGRYYKILRNIF